MQLINLPEQNCIGFDQRLVVKGKRIKIFWRLHKLLAVYLEWYTNNELRKLTATFFGIQKQSKKIESFFRNK